MSEVESTVCDIGLKVCESDGLTECSAGSSVDQRAKRHNATMAVATEKGVELRGFMRVLRIMGVGRVPKDIRKRAV